MPPILADTIGGLSIKYYARQFIFGAIFSFLPYFFATQGKADPIHLSALLILAFNALLYPYSRFIYEQIVGFVMGDNTFYLPLIIMLPAKLFTMMMCWAWAILIAPFGLIYLYIYHRKVRRQSS